MIFHQIKRILQNSSVSLILVIAFALLAGEALPHQITTFLYAISLSIKEILLFILPLVIFTYLASCVLSLRNGAMIFMSVLIGMVVVSNFFSILTAYIVHIANLVAVAPRRVDTVTIDTLVPLWAFSLPKLFRNDHAMFAGLAVGFLFTYKPVAMVESVVQRLKFFVDFFMNRLFIPLLPLFILGFVLKLKHEGILGQILEDYAPVFGIITVLQVTYLLFMYSLAARFHLPCGVNYFRNVFPAALAGFTTMSSAAAMPISIRSAERNTGNSETARAVIPATLNIHMIGDSIAIPIMMMVILRTFGFEPLNIGDYLIFTGYFMIAKFGIVGVPGGSILVMVPVLEAQFGFTPEMSALITALYILFDPIVTATNVSGNGALVILFDKAMKKRRLAPIQV